MEVSWNCFFHVKQGDFLYMKQAIKILFCSITHYHPFHFPQAVFLYYLSWCIDLGTLIEIYSRLEIYPMLEIYET